MSNTTQIKLLRDENNQTFIPYTATSALLDATGRTLDTTLASKLELTNVIQGTGITLTKDTTNNTVTISSNSAGLNLIDNITTTTAGQGALDAHQGSVLKGLIDAVPVVTVVDNLTTVSSTDALSAYQGYLLNSKFNDYAKLDTANTFTTNQTVNGNITASGGSIYATKTNAEVIVSANYNNTNSIYLYADSSNAGIWSSYGQVCSNSGSGWYFNGNCNYATSAGSATSATSATNANLAYEAKNSTGGSWISGRDHAIAKQTNHTTSSGSSWNPVASVKTASGNWTIGNVGNEYLIFSYDTDYNYSQGINSSSQVYLSTTPGTIALTSQLPTFTLSGSTLYITA